MDEWNGMDVPLARNTRVAANNIRVLAGGRVLPARKGPMAMGGDRQRLFHADHDAQLRPTATVIIDFETRQ